MNKENTLIAMATPGTPECLNVGHLNINSLKSKMNEIKSFVKDYNLQVLAVSETHLETTVEDSEVMMEGFRMFRKDRDRCGGGVALYVQNQIKSEQQNDLMQDDTEMVWIRVSQPGREDLLVGCCYRRPNTKIEHLDKILEQIKKVAGTGKSVLLLGDFNIDWLKESPKLRRFKTEGNKCGLTQIVKVPTRRAKATCIDHIYTNIPEQCSSVVVIKVECSDHDLLTVSVTTKEPRNTPDLVGGVALGEPQQEDMIQLITEIYTLEL